MLYKHSSSEDPHANQQDRLEIVVLEVLEAKAGSQRSIAIVHDTHSNGADVVLLACNRNTAVSAKDLLRSSRGQNVDPPTPNFGSKFTVATRVTTGNHDGDTEEER